MPQTFKESFTIFPTTKIWDDKFLLFLLDFSIFVQKMSSKS